MSAAEFLDDVDTELAGTDPAVVLTPEPFRSTARYAFSTVRLSSVGLDGQASYRIAGYLSVPTTPGPHPGLLELPRHGSVNHTPHANDRERFVVFTLVHRGQRRADTPFAAEYPGLLRRGIEDPSTWIYRGIVADCLRGAEFLRTHPAVDPLRTGVVGDDLAILVAARRPGSAAVRVDSLLLTAAPERSTTTTAYPLEELNDLRRAGLEQQTRTAFALLDPLGWAPSVTAPVLVSGPVEPDDVTRALLDALGSTGEHFGVTHRDGLDADARDAWLARRLGVPATSRFLEAPLALPGDPQPGGPRPSGPAS